MVSHPGPSRGSELLEEWRGNATQVQASARLGLNPVSYNRFEHGVRRPPGETTFRIERLTDGKVPAKSWYELPTKQQPRPRRIRATRHRAIGAQPHLAAERGPL